MEAPSATLSEPVTPTDLVERVRAARAAARAAEVTQFELALEWAIAHPDLDARPSTGPCPGGCRQQDARVLLEEGDYGGGCVEGCAFDPDGFDDPFIPRVEWSASAPFAAALGRSTAAGDLYIRDALITAFRLPRIWARVVAGEVEVWRARRIAQAVIGRPADVADALDAALAPRADACGMATIDRLLEEQLLRLYPEQHEQERLARLEAREVRVEPAGRSGLAFLSATADAPDLIAFDRTVSRVAAALGVRDAAEDRLPDSLSVRRARALGVLADPAAALELLADPAGGGAPLPTRTEVVIHLHLTPDHLLGHDPVVRCGVGTAAPLPVLADLVRDWCGAPATAITVRPVLDLAETTHTEAYEVPDRTRRRVEELVPTCAFPWCGRSSAGCDQDHIVPFDHTRPRDGGQTTEANLAPLCRRHHRLKTHAGWRYTPLDPGTYLWSDPHGQAFLRSPEGTRDVTRARRPSART